MDRKALSLPILISLVVGNMIGTGIYVLPASLAPYGSLALVAWVCTSLGALFLALTFAHLNKRFPRTGGPYAYCKEAYGRLPGFIIAYTYWISYLVAVAGIAVSSVSYLGVLSPALDANRVVYDPHLVLFIEISVVWLFTLINILGIHTAGVVQLGLTIIKIIPLLIITLFGISAIHLENITAAPIQGSHFMAVSHAAALTFWAFIGLESATVPAENTAGAKDIFNATVWGTLVVSFIYIFSTLVLMGMIPHEILQHSQFPFAEAATLLFGPVAATLIAIGAVISGIGALNVCILIQGQIVFAAARDQLFPKRFAKLSQQDVPVAGQLLSSTIVTILLIMTIEPTLLKQFNQIALLAGLLTLITYFVTTLAEIKFLLADHRPLYPILWNKSFIMALLAAVYSGWMISSFSINLMLISLGLIVCCIPIYFYTVRND